MAPWYNPATWIPKADIVHQPPSATWLSLPGTKFDYSRHVRNPLQNSAVAATVGWVARAFPEAPLEVWDVDSDGERAIVNPHELSALIRRPTAYHSGTLLWMSTITELLVTGNAYWLIVRNGAGRPVELWPIPSVLITPKAPATVSDVFISHYEYRPSGKPVRLEVADVVHIRHGIDPDNMRKGLSPLGALIREIYTDNEAGNYSAALLRNFGMPGVVFSPRDAEFIDAEAREEIKTRYRQEFGGDNVGGVLVSSGAATVTPIGFSPADMDLASMRQIPEERITAGLGIPAAVVGLGTGLETTKVGATLHEYREQAWENAVVPLQRLIAEQVQNQLGPRFRLRPSQELAFDLRHVRVLQDDQDKLYSRLTGAVSGGWLKVSQAQAMAGLEVDEEQDGYLRNIVSNALVRDEEAEPQALPPAGEPGPGEAQDFEGPSVADPRTEVQALALNGAQIASMLEVLQNVTSRLLSPDTATALLAAAFPSLTAQLIQEMVGSAAEFVPALPAEPEE